MDSVAAPLTWSLRVDLPEGFEAASLTESLEANTLLGETLEESLDRTGRVTALTLYTEDRGRLVAFCEQMFSAGLSAQVTPLRSSDWVARSRASLPPLSIGPFHILDRERHPVESPRPRRFTLDIPASLAFGTGHHETTALCLEALLEVAKSRRPRRVLDLGCGSAILALAAHRLGLGTDEIIASDNDPLAIETARRIARLNGNEPAIKFCVADGFAHADLQRRRHFDLVFANILFAPLQQLAHDLAQALAPGGPLIVSGLLLEQIRPLTARYRTHGLLPKRVLKRGEWAAIVFTA